MADADDDPATFSGYSALHVDAIIQIAAAADALIRAGGTPDNPGALFNSSQSLRLRDVAIEGITGPLVFDSNGDRLGTLTLLNYQRKTLAHQSRRNLQGTIPLSQSRLELTHVGRYSTLNGQLFIDDISSLIFSGGINTNPPRHCDTLPPAGSGRAAATAWSFIGTSAPWRL